MISDDEFQPMQTRIGIRGTARSRDMGILTEEEAIYCRTHRNLHKKKKLTKHSFDYEEILPWVVDEALHIRRGSTTMGGRLSILYYFANIG